MKRCSISLITREIQIRKTMKYHLTPVRMTVIKKTTNKNIGEDVKKGDLFYIVGRNANWFIQWKKG